MRPSGCGHPARNAADPDRPARPLQERGSARIVSDVGPAGFRTVAAVVPQINLIDHDAYQRGGPPHDQFRWLRANAPVYWHANGG